MEKDDIVYLRHILDAIARIERYTEGIIQKEFNENHGYPGVDLNLVWDTVNDQGRQ